MTPTLHTATHATSTVPRIPRHHDAVDVLRSTFIPFGNLREEFGQQDMLRVTDDWLFSLSTSTCVV